MAKQTVQVDEVEDFEVDDVGYNVDDGFEDVVHDVGSSVPEAPSLTSTENFMGVAPQNHGIEDMGVVIVEQDESTRVSVKEDVGPVYYGAPDERNKIHMIKERVYNVPPHIYEYLHSRKLMVGQ